MRGLGLAAACEGTVITWAENEAQAKSCVNLLVREDAGFNINLYTVSS
jgi:hypothetical protein